MFWLWTETVMKHRCIYVKLHNFSLYKQLMRCTSLSLSQLSSKRSSSFRRAIANGRRTLQREILLDEMGLGVYKRFMRYVAYEILPCETDRRWYFHQSRLCPPPVFMAIITIVQVHLTELCVALSSFCCIMGSSDQHIWFFVH